jgi:3-oxoacyl-[acyl-carrier protein] reductase
MKNKTIVITGVTGGVGKSIAKRFIDKNWNVIGISRNSKLLVDEDDAFNRSNFIAINANINNHHSISDAFDNIEQIDVLINNAATFITKPFIESTPEEVDSIIDLNLKGYIFCTLNAIKKIKKGRIINIGSVSGLHGIKNQAIYSSSKFGVIGFTESIAQELIDKVLFTTICPGGINTPLWNSENPYNGSVEDLLKSEDIVKTVEYIIDLPDNVIVKNITIFPKNEWH